MSIRNKLEQFDRERHRAEEEQRAASEAIGRARENQRRLEESQKEESANQERRRITEANRAVIQRSGIDAIMNEAADIKKTELEIADDNSRFYVRWKQKSVTGELLGRIGNELDRPFNNKIICYMIEADIEPQSISILSGSGLGGGEKFTGLDMYNREKLEVAVANALLDPIHVEGRGDNGPGWQVQTF